MSKINVRIALLGNSSVGKSSIIRRFVDNKFDDNYMSTLGVDYFDKKVIIKNKTINVQIQDTSGEERFRSIATSYYKNVDGIIFVFDVTNKESFKEGIKYWLTECDNQMGEYKRILVGNKIDLKDMIAIKKETMEKFAEDKGMKCFETSAKEGTNVDIIFRELTELILMDLPKKNEEKNKKLGNKNDLKNKSCC